MILIIEMEMVRKDLKESVITVEKKAFKSSHKIFVSIIITFNNMRGLAPCLFGVYQSMSNHFPKSFQTRLLDILNVFY